MSNSTTIVPLVLWGKKPPIHSINVITCSYDQKTIITGTLHGQIGLWDLRHTKDGGLKIIPRNLLFAHGCKVVSIACALDSNFERPNIVSLAENGELCLWDIEDGLCLQINSIPGAHTGLNSIQFHRGNIKEWRLVCHGLYSEIHIIDSLSLQILYSLKSRISPNWISAVCFLRLAREQEELLIGLTVSCCIKVWIMNSTLENKGEFVYEDESKTIDCVKAKAICANPFTQRILLVISAKTWQVYDACEFNFLAALPAPKKIPLVNGDFVASDRVLLWNKLGNAFMYKLPSRYLLSDQIDANGDRSFYPPVMICQFDSFFNQDAFRFPTTFSYGRRMPFYKLLIQGSHGGICIWKVPDNEEKDEMHSKLRNTFSALGSTEVTISHGGIRKTLLFDQKATRTVSYTTSVSLKQLWQDSMPISLYDNVQVNQDHSVVVTCSLYLPSQGKLVCGRTNGTIFLVDAIKAALAQLIQPAESKLASYPPYIILHGHVGQVTSLLYPHDENPRYDRSLLMSGGADFTVRGWDLVNGSLITIFHCHGGEILKLMVTPPDCNPRFLQCVCSVAKDHSVALVGLRERKVVLLASRHTFPVVTIRWRVKEDFMVVGCSDGTVYVWQMETGHLDRCAAGPLAYEILESCDEEISAPSAAVREHQRKFHLHQHLTKMTNRIHIDLKAPAMVKRMKSRMASLHHHVTGSFKHHQTQSLKGENRNTPLVLPPMRVCALQACVNDPEIHVILLDPEALIKQLLSDEADFYKKSDFPANPKRHHNVDIQVSGMEQSYSVPYEVAQLLLSCCHSWGLDQGLDSVCIQKLGILKPVKALSFGLLTRGRLALMFPGWYISGEENYIATSFDADLNPDQNYHLVDDELQKTIFNAHWQLSSSLTTQHLVSLVSVTNTLMSMNYVSFAMKGESNQQTSMSSIRSEVKAGWSLLAALHCCMLPDAMKGLLYRPPLLHILARRWQDRCLEIREAAQAILLAELQRIGPSGRKQLIDAWSPHLPQNLDAVEFGFEDLEQYVNNEDEKSVFPNTEEDHSDIAMVMMTTRKMVSSDIRLRHATAIIMLGVIGAEFQKEVDPVNRDSKGSNSYMDVNVVRMTAKALTTLLLRRQSSSTPAYSAIRRAAIDLIGRGFALWEPHIDVSQVIIGLFELCGDIDNQLKSEKTHNFSIPAAKDLHRSAKHALSLISTARPSACITTLAKEIARHVAYTSSMSFTQPSPAAIAVYSHVRQQPSALHEAPMSTVLHSARSEILRVMEYMIEKNQQQVIEFIVEVVDIIVHLLDFKTIKEKGLTEICPALFKFGMVSYCNYTRRLAVGSRLGHIALYELRSSRCQIIPAHETAVSALAFSPEGKYLASFSFSDKKINFYQTSSSLLGMLSSTIKCIHSYNTAIPDNNMAGKTIRILWTSKKRVVLLLGDGSQQSFTA
ncbi:WD repeat-containing protein 7 isoform X1 [Hydra vulgaris]|uniref:WD repeat-containing protein 7 isoform X1 n=1 Tax=Hydra vulgaris TaxID=6087 RepID=UPI001F5F8D17|nr:WD repeat-containing protein 7 [Hydra vulgaris]